MRPPPPSPEVLVSVPSQTCRASVHAGLQQRPEETAAAVKKVAGRSVPGPRAALLHLLSCRRTSHLHNRSFYLTWIRYATQLLPPNTHTPLSPPISLPLCVFSFSIPLSLSLATLPPPSETQQGRSASPHACRQTYASLPVRFQHVWEKRDCLMFINHLSVEEGSP